MIKINNLRKRAGIITLSVLIIFFQSALFSSGTDQPLREYLRQKGLCNYGAAMDILEEWTFGIDDKSIIETNIFRIGELVKYPELNEKALSVLRRIREKAAVKDDLFLRARIDFFIMMMCMRFGKTVEAAAIRDSLGFVRQYKIVGPFKGGSRTDFDTCNPPEDGYSRGARYQGKTHVVGWFNASPDLTGAIDLKDFYPDVADSVFYLECDLDFPSDGQYAISFGKTGFTDIFLDGENIFSSRNRHSFSCDQYRLRVNLSKGGHRILVKTGDSAGGGLRIALRITDGRGNAVSATPCSGPGADAGSELLGAGYFETLENIINDKSSDNSGKFDAGYLFFAAGLNSDEERESAVFFSAAGNYPGAGSASEYYMGLLEREDEKKDSHFQESIKRDPENIEAIAAAAGIMIKNNFIFEAYPLAGSIKKIKPLSVEYLLLKADIALALGWEEEAERIAGILINTAYPSAGRAISADINWRDRKYREALPDYTFIYALNRDNPDLIDKISVCRGAMGDYSGIEKILLAGLVMFPNSVPLRLRLAEVKSNFYRAGEALPYLASAAAVSPYNSRVCLAAGMVYHKIGKTEPALKYLRRALIYEPDNFDLKRFLENITDKGDDIGDYLIRESPEKIAGDALAFRDEPVIVLLNETAFRVMADGSCEKRVHQVFQINDRDAAAEFTSQYVVINPETERLEDFRCAVINIGERMEITDISKRSLSDPESRLYYDLQANIITLPSVRKGSIVETRYTIKNSGGALYRNYFGEKITAGREHRTIISNTLLSFPAEKKIYCHLKGIDEKSMSVKQAGERKVYHILIRNIPPFKAEPAMPHYSEISPSICFTSHRDWAELHGWYAGLLRGRKRMSADMQENLSSIIGPSDGEMEKIDKIYNHVSRQVRYVGFEFGIGGIQPRGSDVTYHTRMGDCKDISLVLVAMLRAAGVDAKLALLRVAESGAANLDAPYIGEFNHAICYVASDGGFFLDGTAKRSGYRELPAQDRGVTALVMDENGYSFINTDSGVYRLNVESETTDAVLHPGGGAALSRTVAREGNLADMLRSSSMDPEAWRQEIDEFWNARYPGSKISDVNVISMDLDGPASYNYRIEAPVFFDTDGDNAAFRSFLFTSNYYRDYAMLKDRRFPLCFTHKWKSVVKIRYKIPGGFIIYKIPESESLRTGKFSAEFIYKNTGGGEYIEAESVINFNEYRLEAGEYGRFRDFALFVERKENEKIILIKKHPEK